MTTDSLNIMIQALIILNAHLSRALDFELNLHEEDFSSTRRDREWDDSCSASPLIIGATFLNIHDEDFSSTKRHRAWGNNCSAFPLIIRATDYTDSPESISIYFWEKR